MIFFGSNVIRMKTTSFDGRFDECVGWHGLMRKNIT
jgi:hypothetical protein